MVDTGRVVGENRKSNKLKIFKGKLGGNKLGCKTHRAHGLQKSKEGIIH